MKTEYSVSLWSADLTNLGKTVKELEEYADYFHFDVADGHFVPNLLFFPDLVRSLRPLTNIPFEVHLIVESPEQYIDCFAEAGANIISVYPEACEDLPRTLLKIKERNVKVSLSLSPRTSIAILKSVADMLDFIVIMGTEVGVKGRSLLPSTYQKIAEVKKILESLAIKDVKIEVDGGIRKETVPLLIRAGANILVPGSLVFNNKYSQIFSWLRQLDKNLPDLEIP
jgi:ribulose-phosphate 3-epimerase